MKVIRETELLSSIVWSLEINSHETIWLGTVNLKHVFVFNNASYFQSICYSTYVEMIRFIPHVMTSHLEYKCIFIWVLNWYLYCCYCIDITTCTEIGIWEKLRRSHFNMDGSQLWAILMPPSNTLSAKSENETGRLLHYKVQNTNLPLCFLIIFSFLVKNLSNPPVMNIKHYQHAWD